MAPKDTYCAVTHGGLEVIPKHDAPEAYNRETPEVSLPLHAPLEKRSSYNLPEPLKPEFHEHSKPTFSDGSDSPAREYIDSGVEVASRHGRKRRWCGMRRRTCIIIIVAAVLLGVGAILGATLGTMLHSDDTETSREEAAVLGNEGTAEDTSENSTEDVTPGSTTNSSQNNSTAELPSVQHLSGYATAWLEGRSETLLAYYQDTSGAILENRFSNGKWLIDASNANDSIVVGHGVAAPGSPISAVSYRFGGQIHRQIFFQDSDDRLMTSNITGAATFESWSEPHNVLNKRVRPDNIALAACVEPTHLSTISLFYGSNSGSIWQAYWALNGTGVWSEGARLKGSEDRSGVACHTLGAGIDSSLEVFYSNIDNHMVARTIWTEVDQGDEADGSWVSTENETVKIGSDLAFTIVESDSGYLFYQNEEGSIRRGFIDGSSSMLQAIYDLRGASNGTKLAAAFIENDTVYMAQKPNQAAREFVFSAGADGDEKEFPAMF